ncbi:hypothetical protein ACKWTF_002153 [Chironomus riparius]
MSSQRLTRSNSLNSKDIISEVVAKGRKFSDTTSPELDIKVTKKTKSSSARDMELDKTLKAMRDDLSTITKSLANLPILEQKIDLISTDISSIKKEFNEMKTRIKNLELDQKGWSEKIDSNQVQINIAKQIKLDEQVMITDIPTHITKENFVANINDWSKNLLENLGYKKLSLTQSKKSRNAFLHFWSIKDKFQFMEYIKNHQKKDEKYVPILNEQVFKLNEDDISKTNTIHFQTPMTKMNQEIFKEARTYKKEKKIESCWMMEGSIFIKKNPQAKGIRVDTIQHLKRVMNIVSTETSQGSSSSIMDITDT